MTRVELLKGLCDITDTIERLSRTYGDAELDSIANHLDAMIDACVRGGLEPLSDDDTSPCPHCGQDVCTKEEGR